MDSIKAGLDVIFVVVSIGLIGSMIWMSVTLYKYYKTKKESLEKEIEYRRLETENKNKTVEYSNKVLELIRSIVGQIAVLKFRTFQDTHEMDKVTKENAKGLVDDVAKMAKNSLNMNNIFLDDTFFTQEFVEQYIVETSVILIKQMMDKSVNELED
jgi:hypothetical protein